MKKRCFAILLTLIIALATVLSGCKSDDSAFLSGNGVGTATSDSTSLIKCESCQGSRICRVCSGAKQCTACDGSGRQTCSTCWGTDMCTNCGAKGRMEDGRTCVSCKGTGKCNSSNCENGYVVCGYCSGSGKCYSCKGNGQCSPCGGTGKCDNTVYYAFITKSEHSSCRGTGTITCDTCTSGTCTKCMGKGKSDCTMCSGSGKCRSCKGDPASKYGGRCSICNSTGTCKYCSGGKKECSYCKGLGICDECHGKHTMKCSNCIDGYNYKDITVEPTPGPLPDPEPINPNPGPITPNPLPTKCTYCSGKGYIDCPQCPSGGACGKCYGRKTYVDSYLGNTRERTCVRCNGSGRCNSCGGKGTKDCTHC